MGIGRRNLLRTIAAKALDSLIDDATIYWSRKRAVNTLIVKFSARTTTIVRDVFVTVKFSCASGEWLRKKEGFAGDVQSQTRILSLVALER